MSESRTNQYFQRETKGTSDAVLSTALQSGNSIRKLELSIEELRAAMERGGDVQGIIPICSQCKRVRDRDGAWHTVEYRLIIESEGCFSHGLCEKCVSLLFGDDVISG